MSRKSVLALLLGFVLANAAILVSASRAQAREDILSCFYFVGGKGCTAAILDDCPPEGPSGCP
jgi:hypothetical protein